MLKLKPSSVAFLVSICFILRNIDTMTLKGLRYKLFESRALAPALNWLAATCSNVGTSRSFQGKIRLKVGISYNLLEIKEISKQKVTVSA